MLTPACQPSGSPSEPIAMPRERGHRLVWGGFYLALLGGGVACDNVERAQGGFPVPVAAAVADAPKAPLAAPAPPAALASKMEYLARTAIEAPEAPEPESCPEGMLLVEGSYCPEVRQRCLEYLDPPGRYEHFRCAKYAPSECVSKERIKMRFCIDRTEYQEAGERLPANFKSFTHAERICGGLSKRVCKESEWNFACEGEEMRPYPYGFERDPLACNADKTDIIDGVGKLRDLRTPADAYPHCTSPFGVLDMAGNLEEFVAMDGRGPVRPAMKGAYWQPSRNHCRAKQTAHDRYYHGTETGFRCCADASDDAR